MNDMSNATLSDLAVMISSDHRAQRKRVYFGAEPYLGAMYSLRSMSDTYGADPAPMIVNYLLCNLGSWKGEVAKAVKKELKLRLKGC